MAGILILWNGSHLWGLMAWRALKALGVPCRLVDASRIAGQKALDCGPAVLLAPGGGARLKAEALGQEGMAAIRAWVADGGTYIGFCGGVGLALSQGGGYGALSLCPWERAPYPERLLHLLSGHVVAEVSGTRLSLPVWWPGRFKPVDGCDVRILASYFAPGEDLWLSDSKFRNCPEQALEFPAGQPLVVSGSCGRGRCLLSYAHLETPASCEANAWLAELLDEFTGIEPVCDLVPDWETRHFSFAGSIPGLADAAGEVLSLAGLGMELGLFFPRAPWLLGWRQGVSGMALNNLLAAFSVLADLDLPPAARKLWTASRAEGRFSQFAERAGEFLRCFHLAASGEEVPGGRSMKLNEWNHALFGHPMLGGGLGGSLLDIAERMLLLALENSGSGE